MWELQRDNSDREQFVVSANKQLQQFGVMPVGVNYTVFVVGN